MMHDDMTDADIYNNCYLSCLAAAADVQRFGFDNFSNTQKVHLRFLESALRKPAQNQRDCYNSQRV